jgi:FlaA1/EpsC-like NDP-sugar epimerase
LLNQIVCYLCNTPPADEFRRIFLACTAGINFSAVDRFCPSRIIFFTFYYLAAWLLSIIFVSLGRQRFHLAPASAAKKGVGVHRVLIIDCDKTSLALIEYFKNNPGSGYKVVGVVEDFSPANQEKILQR